MALGILIPILFHAIGMGSYFLPMFWPVAASAFFLPLPYAIAVGALTPVLSTLTTGMPPPPIVYRMILELTFLAGTTCYVYQKTRYGIFWILLAGMFVAVIMIILGAMAIAPILGLPPRFYAGVSLLKKLPGIIVIMTIIPLIIKKMKHESIWRFRSSDVQGS